LVVSPYQICAPKVLVVDDDPLGLATTKEIMMRLGMITEATAMPQEALRRSLEVRYDYIVLDIEMPTLNGYELCAAIRAGHSKSKNAFIIALSGHLCDREHVLNCLKAGMCDVLSKPITLEQLQRRMSYWKNTGKI
jgi:CheY-like chemotaxis protein